VVRYIRDVSSSPAARRPDLDALTGLRFLAALLVVLFHTGQPHLTAIPLLGAIVKNGWLGVSLFFVHSGFILAYVYDSPVPRRIFYRARIARIVPVYYVALAVAWPVYRWQGGDDTWHIIATLVFLQTWTPAYRTTWNGPSWSLSAEAFFYAVFPMVRDCGARWSTARLVRIAAALWAIATVAWLAWALAYTAEPSAALWLVRLYLNEQPLARLPEFLLGIITGLLYLRGVRLTSRQTYLASATLGLGWLAMPVHAGAGPLSVLFALLMLGLGERHTAISRFLATRPMERLGRASYAVYLLHWPLWAYWSDRTLTGWLLYLLALTATSLTVYKFLEQPLRDRLRIQRS
jgi:peptidoglycan/LPS O-acetylase OafA/YrhL